MMLKAFRLIVFTCLIVVMGAPSQAMQADSLRTEVIDGVTYIIHEVAPQETVFSLSRRYNVSHHLIIDSNPAVNSGLDIGQILRIPVPKKAKQISGETHVVQEKETLYALSKMYNVSIEELKAWNNMSTNELEIGQEMIIGETEVVIEQIPDKKLEVKMLHEVAEKETLYGISKQYEVSIADLMAWNDLANSEISLGQQLIVGEKTTKPAKIDKIEVEVEPVLITQKPDTTRVVKPVVEQNTVSQQVNDTTHFESKTIQNTNGLNEVVQSGLAEVIPNTEDTRKYLALHRTAEIGTIMKVRNEMNNKMVFVRVLGRIPSTGDNDKVLIKLSHSAYARLGALDKRFRVELSYTP